MKNSNQRNSNVCSATNKNILSEANDCENANSVFDQGIDNFRKMMRDKCDINNFAIDTHKNYKAVWEHAFQQGKTAPIEEHPDYKCLMDKYSIKTKCGYVSATNIENHPQFESQRNKWEKQCLSQPINLHPGYQELMDKYAIRLSKSESCGNSNYLPCKNIKKHPDYETEKNNWFKIWNEQPITRHPQYRAEVEKVLQKLLQQLGRDNMCQTGGGSGQEMSFDFNTLVNYYGGAADLNKSMKDNLVADELKQMYQDIVSGQSNPCQKGDITKHPQYKRLVESLTKKIQCDFGYQANENEPAQKCQDALKSLKLAAEKECNKKMSCLRNETEAKAREAEKARLEAEKECQKKMACLKDQTAAKIRELENAKLTLEKECAQKMNCLRVSLEAKIRAKDEQNKGECDKNSKRLADLQYELKCCRDAIKQFKSQPITSHPEYQTTILIEEKLKNQLKDLQNKLNCCQKAFNHYKNKPITEHPDYLKLIKNEQKKLLLQIKIEQAKCQQSNASNQCDEPVNAQCGGTDKCGETDKCGKTDKNIALEQEITTIACGDPEIRCQRQINQKLCQQKKELLDKYACYNGYSYYKGMCGPPKKLEEYDITTHPKICEYVKKSDIHSEKYNYPITQHPDYPKIKVYFKQLLDAKLVELQRQRYPIQHHPDYQKLMDKYACRSNEHPGELKYLPCHEQSQPICESVMTLEEIKTAPNCQNEYLELTKQIKNLQANIIEKMEPPPPPTILIQSPPISIIRESETNATKQFKYNQCLADLPNYTAFNNDFGRLARY